MSDDAMRLPSYPKVLALGTRGSPMTPTTIARPTARGGTRRRGRGAARR